MDIYENYTTTSVLAGIDEEKFTRWSHRYFSKQILPHLSENRNCRILEIGCGYGRYTSLLTSILNYTDVIGIDISREQIEIAKEKFGLNNVHRVDALEYLENTDKKFDFVILMDVLEHLDLEYSIKLLSRIRHSLDHSGKLIIQVPNAMSPMRPIFYSDVTHIRPFSIKSMDQILRMSGFNNVDHYALPPLGLGVLGQLKKTFWKAFVSPLLYIFISMTHGNPAGGIYSNNLLSITTKK